MMRTAEEETKVGKEGSHQKGPTDDVFMTKRLLFLTANKFPPKCTFNQRLT